MGSAAILELCKYMYLHKKNILVFVIGLYFLFS